MVDYDVTGTNMIVSIVALSSAIGVSIKYLTESTSKAN